MLLHFGSHAHNVSQAEAAWANFAARLELEGERVRRTEGSDPRSSHSTAVWGYLPSHFPDGPDGEFNPEHRGRYTQPSARCEAHAAGAAASEPANNFRRGAALRFAARHGLAVLDGWADAVGNHDDHLGGALTHSRVAGRTGAFDCKCAARCRTHAPTGSIAYIDARQPCRAQALVRTGAHAAARDAEADRIYAAHAASCRGGTPNTCFRIDGAVPKFSRAPCRVDVCTLGVR